MKAILVIDMLEDYFREDPLKVLRPELVRSINALTSHGRTAQIPVIWVRQEFSEDLSDAFPVMRKKDIRITIAGTPGSRVLAELERASTDHEIVKQRYSAFYGTSLEDLLGELGVSEVVLAGINTHACVRMAAIDAYQRDLEVVIPRECVASYDAEHHDVTLDYLGKHIARIVALESWLAGTGQDNHAATGRERRDST